MRQLFLLLGLMISMSSLGCAIPVGYGPCGGMPCDSCGDCDGGGYAAGHVLPYGPIDALRQAKRNLVCGGGGCGEVYYGEWRSYPPDCVDPCCGDEFVGGAAPCVPGWAPGALLPRNLVPALYGKRMYHNYQDLGCSSCGDCGSGDCADCGAVSYEEGAPAVHSSGCNCGGNHVSSSQPMTSRPVASSMRSSPTMMRSSPTMARTSAPQPSRTATRTVPRPTEQRTRTR